MGAAASTGRAFGWAVVAVGLLAIPATAQPQPAQKVFRIGYLANSIPLSELEKGTSSHPAVVAFVDGLRSLGWQDGKNVQIVWRSAEGQNSRLPQLAADLARMPVDVIVASGGGVYFAARATKTIPIVMVAAYTPVEDGLAKSYARPGGNVTGITLRSSDTDDHYRKRVALLKEASPGTSRIAYVMQVQGAEADRLLERFHDALAATRAVVGVEVFILSFGDPSGLRAAIQSAVRQGAQGLVFDDISALYDPKIQNLIAEEAVRHRVPVMHQVLTAAAHGALMAYGADITANYRRAPYYVDRILRGVKAGDIPIEQPSRVEFHVNLKAAKAIGLEIPPALLLQADRVIQ